MNCLKAEEQFSAYLEDELNYQTVKAFETHLADCEQCHREFTLFSESLDLLHQLPQIEPSAEFDIDLRSRLANTQVELISFWHRVLNSLRAQPAWALSGVVTLLVMFAGIYLYQNIFVKSPPFEVAIEPNTPSTRIRHVPLAEVRSNELWQGELPLAVPNLDLQSLVKFPEFPAFDAQPMRRRQEPRRMEQNYILQTINYTEAPTGGGL